MPFIAVVLTGAIMLIAIGFSITADRESKESLWLPPLAALSVIAHMTALICLAAQAAG